MYAIIEIGGHQRRVEPGYRFEINRIGAKVGATHPVDKVLLAADGGDIHVGRPFVAGAKVVCEVLEHHLGPKVISYKFRRRENYRKTVGHRQPLSRLLVKEIVVGSKTASAQAAAPKAVKAPAAPLPAPQTKGQAGKAAKPLPATPAKGQAGDAKKSHKE